MNVAGKSLQDIYDAGAKRLEELESAQNGSMNEAAESHLDERMRVEPEALKRLEDKTEELEAEIRAYLQRGLERVERAVASEGQESERYIGRLVEGLVLLSKKFSESIGQLREAAESELSDLSADLQQQYRTNADGMMNRLREDSTSSLDSSRSHGTQSDASVRETVESSWRSVYESEAEAMEALTESVYENTESITHKATEARRNLEETVDHKLLTLEGKLSQANDNVKGTVDTVTEQAERHAFDADVRLKEKFSSLLYEMATSFDDSANRAAADMAGLHESSMADLTMKSQELSRDMDSLAEAVTQSSSRKSEGLQGKGSELMDQHTNDLNQRLEASNVFLKEIEAERSQMVAEIWQELTEVKNRFEEKLNELANSTLTKMKSICEEADNAIVTAQQNCLNESKNHAGSKRDAIQQETHQFIERVEGTRQAALEAIAKAAGATPNDAEDASASTGDDEEGDGDHTNPRPGDTATGMESRKTKSSKKSGKSSSDKRSGDSKK